MRCLEERVKSGKRRDPRGSVRNIDGKIEGRGDKEVWSCLKSLLVCKLGARVLVLELRFVLYSHSILLLCSVRVHSLSSVYVCVNTSKYPAGLEKK